MARRLEKAFGLRAGWMDRENLAGHDYTLVGGRVVLPSAPATQTPGRSDRWRPSLADDNMSEQHPAEKLSDALGTALLGLPTALRPRSVDACRKLAESPDSGLARIELWDVLQHSPALKPAQGTVGVRAQNIDRAFREAFYDVLDNFKTTDGRKLINDLRDAIEHKVADALRLDIDQARRALNARQSEQG